MKRRVTIGIILTIFILATIGVVAYSATLYPISDWGLGDNYSVSYGSGVSASYTMNGLLQQYINNSPAYKSIDQSFSINQTQCDMDDLLLQSCNESIQTYNDLIDQYQNLSDDYQSQADAAEPGSDEQLQAQQNLDSCLLSIQTYQSQLIDAVKQKAEVYSQLQSDSFIKDNAQLIKTQQQNKQRNSYLEACISLITLEAQKSLMEDSANYSGILYSIERTNLSNGRSTQIDVDYADAEYQLQNGQRDAADNSYEDTFRSVLREAGINESQDTQITINIANLRPHSIITYETVENSFIANDMKEKQLADNISIQDGKIDILNDYLPADSVDISLETKQKDLATLEHDKWLLDRKTQLQSIYSTYEQAFRQVDISEQIAEAQYQKYHVALNKYNLGLISRVDLQKALVQFSQSRYDAWNTFYRYVQTYNAIEEAINGVL